MKNMRVKNAVIGKQFKDSKNLQEFLRVANDRRINVIVVESGDRIDIERNLYFDVLWPDESNKIDENVINNNALVCKLNYKNFSMLFTGDIEEEAENVLIYKYEANDILKSTLLKVPHHGSKSSSTEKFLKLVNPKVALIGVGENNKFGHPNSVVLERLFNFGTVIYRTDEEGEVCINVYNDGRFKKE